MKRAINFIGLRWVFILLSIVLIAAGVVGYIVNGGFNMSIDFTSGLNQQFQIDPAAAKVSIGDLRAALAPLGRFDLQAVGNPADQEFVVKVLAPQADSEFQTRTEAQIQELLANAYGADSLVILASDFVGPRYASELFTQTIWIMLVAIILILIYAAFRFKFIYGMAAVLCLIHDSLFMLAVVALFRLEFTATTVAAVLTIIGYSINDTIVIFDRVRENRNLMREADLATLLNTSITQTLGRTVLTSVTVFLSIIALYILGSGDIKNFALLMLVGIVEGAYSTVFIASPIVYMWTRGLERRRKAGDLKKYGHGREAAAPQHERKAAEALEAAEAAPALTPLGTPVFPGPLGPAEEAVEGEAEAGEPEGAPEPVPASPVPAPAPVGEGSGYVRIQPVRRHKKRKR